MLGRICRIVLWAFVLAYAVALGLLLVSTFGLFGQEPDPLSAVFLLPLGLPWNLFLDGFADNIRPWLAAAAPLLNVIVLMILCRLCRARGSA